MPRILFDLVRVRTDKDGTAFDVVGTWSDKNVAEIIRREVRRMEEFEVVPSERREVSFCYRIDEREAPEVKREWTVRRAGVMEFRRTDEVYQGEPVVECRLHSPESPWISLHPRSGTPESKYVLKFWANQLQAIVDCLRES